MKKYNINCPFGPLIYSADISGEFHQFLLDGLEDSRKAQDLREILVGNIDQQRYGSYNPQKFFNFLHPHVVNYLQENYNRHNDIWNMSNHDQKESDLSKSKIEFSLGGGPWVNFQKKGEFNPLHNHTGMVSAVAFIVIPDELEQERENSNFSAKTAGCLEITSNNQHFTIKPREGMMYLFPAWLLHTVYPYHSDVERVSMSFNFDQILIDHSPIPEALISK